MPSKKGRAKGEAETPKFLTDRVLLVVAWLLGFGVLFLYGLALFLEKTAPVSAATGFHISVAGAILYLMYPVATVLQTMLLLVGFALFILGLVENRRWAGPGLALLVLGLGFMAVNYLISQ